MIRYQPGRMHGHRLSRPKSGALDVVMAATVAALLIVILLFVLHGGPARAATAPVTTPDPLATELGVDCVLQPSGHWWLNGPNPLPCGPSTLPPVTPGHVDPATGCTPAVPSHNCPPAASPAAAPLDVAEHRPCPSCGTVPPTTEPAPDTTPETTWPSTPISTTRDSSTPPSGPSVPPTPTAPPTSLSPSTSTTTSSTLATSSPTSLPTTTTSPAPSSVVSVAPPPVWSCPMDGLIRRADKCEIDPCVAKDGTGLSTSYTVVPWYDANGYTATFAIPCLIPSSDTPAPPSAPVQYLPTTGSGSGPLVAGALVLGVLGAILAAVARRRPVGGASL